MSSGQWSASAKLVLPGAAQKHANLIQRGIGLHNARRFREAEHCYQLVLREDPGHPDALNLMGVLAVEAGQHAAAIDYLKKAVALQPKQPIYLNNLGNALIIASHVEDAIRPLKKAVALDPRYAEAWCNLGKAYRQLGEGPAAETYFRRALQADPGFLRARSGLAEVAASLGRLDEAVGAFRKILGLDPRSIDALCGLAVARRFTEGDPEIATFAELLRDPALRNDQRAPLHHAYAKICNDIGRYEDAVAHFVQGKKHKGLEFHMELHRQTYATVKQTFTKALFASRPGFGIADERPLFIVGMPRTGTTLTEQILASHPQVHGLGELPDMRQIGRELLYADKEPGRFAIAVKEIDAEKSRVLAQRYLKVMSRPPSGTLRATDKNPHNFELLGVIALLFPKARVVHCRRDPLDTCVACFMQNFNESHAYNGDLATLGHYYAEYARLMEHWREVLPLPVLDLQYEDMVADQEGTTRRLIEFIGLEWDESCLEYFRTERSVATPSRWQVRQPIYATSVGRWRNYEKYLDPLITALGDLASR